MEIPQINQNLKEWIQVLSWFIGAVGVVATASLGVIAAFRAVRTNKAELRWKKSNLARQLIAQIESDPKVVAVFHMIDLTADDVDIGNGHPETVTAEEIAKSFAAGDGPFTDKDTPIRKCFDCLFTHLEHLQHAIDREMIELEDVRYFFPYHMKNMHKIKGIPPYLVRYKFHLAKTFLDHYSANAR